MKTVNEMTNPVDLEEMWFRAETWLAEERYKRQLAELEIVRLKLLLDNSPHII